MTQDDQPPPPSAALAQAYAAQARAPSTWRGYRSDWADFLAFCASEGLADLPAEPATIGRYLAFRAARLSPGSLDRRLSAIIVYHRAAGHVLDRRDPAIADVLAGIRRAKGMQRTQKDPLLTEDLVIILSHLPNTMAGTRDRALLSLGFASALRRSELALLQVEDVRWSSEGVHLLVRRSKTDGEGQGCWRTVPFATNAAHCPVRLLRAWVLRAHLSNGFLFRQVDAADNFRQNGLSPEAVAAVVKRAIQVLGVAQGWTKAEIRQRQRATGGHSLRAGFCTAAAMGGATDLQISVQTGHRRTNQVRGYVRTIHPLVSEVVRRTGL